MLVNPKCQTAAVAVITMSWAMMPVRLAPMMSARMPIGTRNSAPASTGIATRVNFSFTVKFMSRAM
ncbi:hypothetical protein [Bradyrhizobium sp. USDA 4454]